MYCLLKPCCKLSFKLLSRIKLKHVCIGVGIIFFLDFFGLFTHMFEVSFNDHFVYPYEGDIHEFITALRRNEKPEVPPINLYNYSFIHDIRDKCLEPSYRTLRLVFLVKSSIEHFDRRMIIRNSWGFEKRFSDVPIRTVFLIGEHYSDNELRAKINIESVKYKDIVQADFLDSYFNNTIKTITGFKWAVNYCSNSKFYMFVDDDIYVSVKNVLRFVRNPALYPDYLTDTIKFKNVKHLKNRFKRISNNFKEKDNTGTTYLVNKFWSMNSDNYTSKNTSIDLLKTNMVYQSNYKNRIRRKKKRQVFDFELPDDVRLFAGFVFVTAPHRHKSSKWYVSLEEYPYHLWPPYVTAAAYILSKEALLDIYYASMYTKHFRFDDIFLALAAKKADIEPFHCEEFHFSKKDYTKYNYKYVITSHGYGSSEELLQVWNEQKAMGNA